MTIKCERCAGRCCQVRPSSKRRIAIAGLGTETSTFHPNRTYAPAFHPLRGDEVLSRFPFLHTGTCLGTAADWRGALVGHALPGGLVKRDAFEALADEIISRVRDLLPIDAFWYDIHGAMTVEGMDDSESELLRRIRKVIGPDVIVSTSMDLHGNVSESLCQQTDLITCYRMAPHEDQAETEERACRNLINLLETAADDGKVLRPLKAWIPIPVLLPGEQTSTRIEPARHIYAAVSEVEALPGVIDAAIWVGYCWADEPRNHAVVVVTGYDQQAITQGAEKLAALFWDAHKDFHFVAPTGTFAECLDTALSSSARPYFISDSGDNPTAGGSGDVTWGLTQLLKRPEFSEGSDRKVVYASIPSAEAVDIAVKAGVGAIVTVTAGAEIDNVHAGPITMTGRVHSIKHGDKDAVVEMVLQVGNVFAIITQLRKPYHHESDFTDLELNVRKDMDVAIVKIGYLEPSLFKMAADWMLALTPGGVDQAITRLGHKRIQRPMWPFDKIFTKQPNLEARLIPASNERVVDSSLNPLVVRDESEK